MKNLSMTEGKVTPLLIRFAIPLMLGDLFQQLYIAADTAIVGKFAGDTALAAVSSSTFLIRMLIGLFVGISAGASVVISHNVGAGVLRSVGDSRRPFLFLVISSLSNILLDCLFIICFQMGVFGAALATVLSQAVNAICVLYVMIRTTQPYRLIVKEIRIQRAYVGEILQMGLPAGIQSVIVSLSNVIVQYYINTVGSDAVAGFGIFNKVDGVIMLPGSALAMAAMTFIGQNFGAKK